MIFFVSVLGAPRHIDLLVVGQFRRRQPNGSVGQDIASIGAKQRSSRARSSRGDDAQMDTEDVLASLGSVRAPRSAFGMAGRRPDSVRWQAILTSLWEMRRSAPTDTFGHLTIRKPHVKANAR